MKRLKVVSAFVALLIPAILTGEAVSEMTEVFGPAYVYKGKGHDKKAEFVFTAPVTGSGRMVIKNGGDSGRPNRVSSARVHLNGRAIADPEDFNKNTDVLEYTITLLGENELQVQIGSCKECELEISVLGEQIPTRLPTR